MPVNAGVWGGAPPHTCCYMQLAGCGLCLFYSLYSGLYVYLYSFRSIKLIYFSLFSARFDKFLG